MEELEQKEKIDDPITYKIIGCAMRVHSTLGNGFQEVIYQRALAIEFRNVNLNFQRELEMPIHYQEEHIGSRRVDFSLRIRVTYKFWFKKLRSEKVATS